MISGFRRLTALEELGWDKVSAIVREDLKDAREVFKVSLFENEARKTYNDLDRGYAIVKYRELGYDFAELESVFSLGKRQLSLLQSLTNFPESLQEAIADVGLSTTHALVLQSARAKFPGLDLEVWIERVLKEGLSVGRLKQLIREEQKEEQGLSLFETQELIDEDGNSAGAQFLIRRRLVNPNELDEDEKNS